MIQNVFALPFRQNPRPVEHSRLHIRSDEICNTRFAPGCNIQGVCLWLSKMGHNFLPHGESFGRLLSMEESFRRHESTC